MVLETLFCGCFTVILFSLSLSLSLSRSLVPQWNLRGRRNEAIMHSPSYHPTLMRTVCTSVLLCRSSCYSSCYTSVVSPEGASRHTLCEALECHGAAATLTCHFEHLEREEIG